MKHILAFALVLYSFVGYAQQTINNTIVHNGITREYRLYIPAAYNSNNAVPLLFNLHGYGSNNVQQEFYGNFRPIADTANFIICHPNGTLDATNSRFWNVGFAPSNIDDIGFISTLINAISSDYNIDAASIYSTGMSNGGFMSYSLACGLSDRIAAIASVTGSMTPTQQNSCNPNRPVPVMQIHGTNDPTVPYTGSVLFMHIDTLVKNWAIRNGCDATPAITPVPDNDPTDGSTAERHDYENCQQGGAVAFYKAFNATHTWAGASINLGVTNMDFSASLEIWKFFRQFRHPNPITTSSNKTADNYNNISLYPNPAEHTFVINNQDEKITSIEISDLSGRQHTVYSTTETGNTIIDISNLNKGMYFCIIYSDNGKKIVKKFVKK